jgi:putative lipoic acid-binding regulatory protein
MGELPSIELLESVHQFPGPFVFKVIGRAENGFVGRVVAACRDELAQSSDPPYSFRQAIGGRHVAVTLEPTLQTASQVLAIYRRMRSLAGLVMLL